MIFFQIGYKYRTNLILDIDTSIKRYLMCKCFVLTINFKYFQPLKYINLALIHHPYFVPFIVK